jgi:serine/threonine protein kinase
MAEHRLLKPLSAFEIRDPIEVGIDPERAGTSPMTVHLHASASRGRLSAHGSLRPGRQPGLPILERPTDMQSLNVQIQEKAFFGAMFAESGINIGKVKTINDFLQLHLTLPMEPVPLSWDGLPAARSLQPGDLFAARFKLIEHLGQGDIGAVWLAEDTKLKSREVALKFLPVSLCNNTDAIDDLRNEVLLSRELTHDNIIRIYDLIEAEGTAAISMEYIRGMPLCELSRQQPKSVFTTEQLLPWVKQLCAALDYAHGKGIIHHDLKPQNLIISDQGVLKICDFGFAGRMAESRGKHTRRKRMTQESGVITPYMSPQHLLLGSRTVADDVYALGATLYELLTSKPPFSTGSIEIQIQTMLPLSISERRRLLRITSVEPVPEHWERVVQSCLSKEELARPAKAGAVCKQLAAPSIAAEKRRKAEVAAAERRRRVAKRLVAAPSPLNDGSIGKQVIATLPGGVSLTLCYCPAGSFTMGSPASEAGRAENEAPSKVTISQPFWLARTIITQTQWTSLMGGIPAISKATTFLWKTSVGRGRGTSSKDSTPEYPRKDGSGRCPPRRSGSTPAVPVRARPSTSGARCMGKTRIARAATPSAPKVRLFEKPAPSAVTQQMPGASMICMEMFTSGVTTPGMASASSPAAPIPSAHREHCA